jgi:hypothetical protein
MELTVKERLALQTLLPKETNFITLRLVRKLREDLSFDDEENKALQFKVDGDRLTWDFSSEMVKEIEIGETLMAVISKDLQKKDEQNKLTEDLFSLYEKFVIQPLKVS